MLRKAAVPKRICDRRRAQNAIPDDKLKFLMEMKKIFALSISTGILLKEVNSLPFIVVRGIHIGKAKKLINQTTFPDCYKFSGE